MKINDLGLRQQVWSVRETKKKTNHVDPGWAFNGASQGRTFLKPTLNVFNEASSSEITKNTHPAAGLG